MKANGGKFRLRDLLSVPMQRILKYHLLLRVSFLFRFPKLLLYPFSLRLYPFSFLPICLPPYLFRFSLNLSFYLPLCASSVLCRMKMLPVMISANYHSSARSAVSESPNSSARLVSQCPNSSTRLVSQCPNSSSRLVFPMFQVELATRF